MTMARARTYRGISADDRRSLRRRQLVDAALELWGAGDGTRVTMTAICQTAHLTERYFYESFPQLDHALVAVVDEIGDRIQRATVVALAGAGADPLDRATAVVDAFVRTVLDDPRLGRIVLLEAAGLEATRPRRELVLRRLARLTAREARRLHGPATWSEADGPLLATMFVGGVVQVLVAALEPDGPTADEVVAVAARAFRAIS